MTSSYKTVYTQSMPLYQIVVDWCYETVPLNQIFNTTDALISEMQRRVDAGIDHQFSVRVRAIHHGNEIASETMSSCYSYGCSPDTEIVEKKLGGYLDIMLLKVKISADNLVNEMTKTENNTESSLDDVF